MKVVAWSVEVEGDDGKCLNITFPICKKYPVLVDELERAIEEIGMEVEHDGI